MAETNTRSNFRLPHQFELNRANHKIAVQYFIHRERPIATKMFLLFIDYFALIPAEIVMFSRLRDIQR